jgi:hypothetical protein
MAENKAGGFAYSCCLDGMLSNCEVLADIDNRLILDRIRTRQATWRIYEIACV